MESADAFAT